jgi:polyphosphate kinase 2 (PPK2 family)
MLRLRDLDLEKTVSGKGAYQSALDELQLKLLHQQIRFHATKRSLVIVFEGPDAAGKGGVIKRVTEHLDPRQLRVYSVAKPTTEEHRHHYLWRFWNRLPGYGEMAVFDRSWYGRVLVERIEKFATDAEWKRAYREINEFERQLTDDGAIVIKFYISISKEEQLRRFKKRESDPTKMWKMNDEDWRNRRKWDEYIRCADDMFAKTHQRNAPWTLVEGDHKWYSRLKVLRTITATLERELAR